jgi:hypothetical protein
LIEVGCEVVDGSREGKVEGRVSNKRAKTDLRVAERV